MVEITIYFEGGTHPNNLTNRENAAQTSENTNRLRDSFSKLFNSIFDEEKVKIKTEPVFSNLNAAKSFKNRVVFGNCFLLIDLDNHTKTQRLDEFDLKIFQEFVFFMVKATEAWILSQPEKIEEVFGKYRNEAKKHEKISEYHEIKGKKGKDFEQIVEPDTVLDKLLKEYFEETKFSKSIRENITIPLKYGKLKNAPDLIAKLDIKKLSENFEDVKNLIERIKNIS